MKKTTLFLSFLMLGLAMFGQYTGNKLPSGLTVSSTVDSADYTIIQKNGETIVKAVRMDTLKSFFSTGIIESIEPLDSVSGSTGQFIISDGSGWLAPVSAKYEGNDAYTFGYRIGAVGYASHVIGGSNLFRCSATNQHSIAFGYGNSSTGLASTVFGAFNSSTGQYSFANGFNSDATGGSSFVNGSDCVASGDYSFAFGKGSTASGDNATAWGSSDAIGGRSTAWGSSTASGGSSTAWGDGIAQSYYETAFGKYCDTAATKTSTLWVSTDRLLTIGNGTLGSPSNALVMLKNGNTTVSGQWSFNAGLIVGTDTTAASSANVGAIRYRVDANNSWCEMVMQTGAATWEWVVIKTNTW